MIEISEKVSQVVYFPKTMKSTGPYTLKIHSELSQKDWYIDNLLDQANLNDYYKFTVDFSNVDDGEFNYEIRKADDVFDTGLIRIGVVQNYGDGYNTQVEIIQYDQYASPQIRYQHKSISATTNGNYYVTPDAGYAALSEVDVHVDVPSQTINNKSLNKIFANNNVDIINRIELGQKKWYAYHSVEQPELPSGYTGFYPVSLVVGVDITSVYDSGYTDGVEAASGGSYQQGYDDGEAAQKAKLVATTITANNTYTRADGWKSVTVNVPQTGHTDQELLNAFNSGYTNGRNEGYQSGYTAGYASGYTDGWNDCSGQTPTAATAITLTLPSAITGSGQANVIVHPANAPVNITYTSSDPTIATISNNGTINVLSAGTVTITATDSISQLTDSEVITVAPYSGKDVPFTIEVISAGTINWYASNSAETRTIQYKINNGEWTNITSSKNPATISVYAGDKVLFRGDNASYSSGSSYNNSFCGSTAVFEVEGNIMSLIDSTGYTTATTLQNGYNFSYLFYRCLGLVNAENLILPATGLAPYCYERMFSFCNRLTAPPELPATTLSEGCYYHMFYNCMALQRAQTSLPATTLANNCYNNMFCACPVLGQIPAILPATTLAPGCYKFMFGSCWILNTVPELPATTLAEECYASMFNDCRSLAVVPVLPATNLAKNCYAGMLGGTKITTAPTLPATTLADFCYYYMFGNCTGLTSAPALPATTLASNCYDGMFSYCSNLSSAPVLEAPTLVKYCYSCMFQGCTNVNYIKCLATNISATGCTSDWLKNAAVNGTFAKDQNMSDWTRGTSGIPVNWLIVDAQ